MGYGVRKFEKTSEYAEWLHFNEHRMELISVIVFKEELVVTYKLL